MRQALSLAEKARGFTSPNPMVGALLVKGSKIIARDFHKKPGAPHAEALVIDKAGKHARGSVLYVNLEPCCHTDKKTPPCTKAIIKSGIKKVVVSMRDPNPRVSGKGIKELRDAGIHVTEGILERDAQCLNEAYIKYITTKMPLVILKIAMSLDGKIAAPDGESKWITGEKAREHVRRLRSSVDAVLTGIGTVRADNPKLTARIKNRKDPVRIIIDPNLEISPDAEVVKIPPHTIIVTQRFNASANSEREGRKNLLKGKGIEFIEYEGEKADLKWLMQKLGEKEISSVLIEAGSSLNSSALEHGIVDKVMFYIAPKIIGGKESYPAVGGKSFKRLSDAYRLNDIKIKRISEDILIEGYIK